MLVCLVDADGPEMGSYARIWLTYMVEPESSHSYSASRRVGRDTATSREKEAESGELGNG
jgi:hypothetical protein